MSYESALPRLDPRCADLSPSKNAAPGRPDVAIGPEGGGVGLSTCRAAIAMAAYPLRLHLWPPGAGNDDPPRGGRPAAGSVASGLPAGASGETFRPALNRTSLCRNR